MLNNKNISELLIEEINLSLEVSVPDILFIERLGQDKWKELKEESIKHTHGHCQGCGYNPPEKEFLELHVVSGEVQNEDSYKFAVLCKTCHTLQHIDEASDKGWIKLVNSLFDQKKLISICRSGNNHLMNKLKIREIILLNTDPKKYAEDIDKDVFNKRKKMKAIFGKNFPTSRLK